MLMHTHVETISYGCSGNEMSEYGMHLTNKMSNISSTYNHHFIASVIIPTLGYFAGVTPLIIFWVIKYLIGPKSTYLLYKIILHTIKRGKS